MTKKSGSKACPKKRKALKEATVSNLEVHFKREIKPALKSQQIFDLWKATEVTRENGFTCFSGESFNKLIKNLKKVPSHE